MIVERVCDLGANHSPTAEGRRAFSYAGNIFRIRKDTLLSALAEKTAPRAERPSMPGNYRFVRRCNVTKESITAQWPETACGCLWVSYSRNGIREDFQVVSLSANEWPQALQSSDEWTRSTHTLTEWLHSLLEWTHVLQSCIVLIHLSGEWFRKFIIRMKCQDNIIAHIKNENSGERTRSWSLVLKTSITNFILQITYLSNMQHLLLVLQSTTVS